MSGVVWVVDVEAKPERVWVRGLLYDTSGGDEVREMGSRGPQAAVMCGSLQLAFPVCAGEGRSTDTCPQLRKVEINMTSWREIKTEKATLP